MEFFKEILGKIWYILYPFLFYYAVMLIIMTIAQWAFGGDATHYVLCQLIATIFTIPSMVPMYRQGQALAGVAKQHLESAGNVSVMHFLRPGSWHALEFL